MNVASWHAAIAAAPVSDAGRVLGEGGLVVLAPHPDDETIGCSSLLLAAARAGRPVGIVALTDGEGSHPHSREVPPDRLAAIRVREHEAAVAELGCAHAQWLRLGLPDGSSDRDPRLTKALDEVAAFCETLGATVLAAPHPDDPHPDHHAAAAIALALRERLPRLRVVFYEVWIRRLGGEEPWRAEGLTPLRLRTDPDRKRAALAHHRSQLGAVVSDDPQGFVLPDWFLRAVDEPLEPFSWLALPGERPDAGHFASLYAEDGDPWHVRVSAYEAEKREAAVVLLGGRGFARSLEAGCGEGHLTAALLDAGVVKEGLGFDREPEIVARANAMGWGVQARFETGAMPNDMPAGPFDLMIFSEVLYFLSERELGDLAARVLERLAPGGAVLVVCYRGRTDTPLGGCDAADVFALALGERMVTAALRETPDYRMELLELHPAQGAGPRSAA